MNESPGGKFSKITGGTMKAQWKRMCMAVVGVMLLTLTANFAAAQSSAVTVSFVTLTAPHAALGAPIKWELTFTNTGATTVTVGANVTLKAPDTTQYSVY